MIHLLSDLLLGAALAGCLLLALQSFLVSRFLRQVPRAPRVAPPISILKPLCGLDDSLEENLRSFGALDYPDYEVLLGLESPTDAALSVARRVVARWPRRFRIVFQRGAAGLNPKVNQLVTLSRAAAHDILVVSDSNVQVDRRYLAEIAAIFEDPRVGLIGHAIAGVGERTLGSLFDNVYLTTHCTAGLISAKALADQDLVIGKSMAFRRADLEALGGFESVQDVLAEDYVLGRRVSRELGKRVAFGRCLVQGVSEGRTVRGFLRRYERWTIMQNKVLPTAMYVMHVLLYPFFLATLGLLLHPSRGAAATLIAVAVVKSGLDLVQGWLLRPSPFPAWAALWIPFLDLLVGWCWIQGFFQDRVEWRGHEVEVLRGTRLRPVGAPENEELDALAADAR